MNYPSQCMQLFIVSSFVLYIIWQLLLTYLYEISFNIDLQNPGIISLIDL